MSLMSPIAVQCGLSGVQLDSSDVSVAASDETVTFNITAEELIAVLDLKLTVGTVADSTYTAFTDAVPEVGIGSAIRVQLSNIAVPNFR